jgi:hypothetical protein
MEKKKNGSLRELLCVYACVFVVLTRRKGAVSSRRHWAWLLLRLKSGCRLQFASSGVCCRVEPLPLPRAVTPQKIFLKTEVREIRLFVLVHAERHGCIVACAWCLRLAGRIVQHFKSTFFLVCARNFCNANKGRADYV